MTFSQRAWEFITSLKLTIFLLAGIGILLIAGTIYETKYGSQAALAVIYRSPLMDGLIFLLGINQITCTIKRYPYKMHQIGWLLTHLGVLVILVGAIYGRRGELEGNIILQEGQSTDHFVMQIEENGEEKLYEVPLGFTVTLEDFEVDTYPGTSMASEYRSQVVAHDLKRDFTIQHTVRVNYPLMYRGFVIAQQSYQPAAPVMGTPATSIFSVLKNPGTPVIFTGFIIISGGIFIIVFFKPWLMDRFSPAKRRKKKKNTAAQPA
ncbi:cytochrome c biogenesis protein ResB [bacterium]|nr:cytochrome c biogenesis protein ResB [bacterium]